METRSKRQQASHRPPYPQIPGLQASGQSASNTSSAFPSSSSLSSLRTPGSALSTSGSQPSPLSSQQGFTAASAPLPSPMAKQPANYFGSIGGPAFSTSSQAQQSRTTSSSQQQAFVGQQGAGGGMPETAPFLNNFNLIAEAAKRAQMDCLMRDLGEVEL